MLTRAFKALRFLRTQTASFNAMIFLGCRYSLFLSRLSLVNLNSRPLLKPVGRCEPPELPLPKLIFLLQPQLSLLLPTAALHLDMGFRA